MPKYYLLDENKNLVEGYDKEGFLALLEEAIEQGSLENIDENSAVASKLRSVFNGTTHHIEFVTQAQYNELETEGELVPNTYYFITDDTTLEEFEETINQLSDKVDELEERIETGLRSAIGSIACGFDFSWWHNSETEQYSPSDYETRDLSLTNNHGAPNAVNILPINCMNSIAEAKVEFYSGFDVGAYYTLDEITSEQFITFTYHRNSIAGLSVHSLKYYGSHTGYEEVSTTFKLSVRDIYGNVHEKLFTIRYLVKDNR